MRRLPIRMILMLSGVVALLVNLSCTTDDLPVTPGGPFLFSDMMITSTTTPVQFSTLTRGQHYTTRFKVAYTLDPGAEALLRNNSLALFADVYTDNTDSSFTVLATTTGITLTSNAGVIADSLSFTVPANALFVNVEAYLDTIPFANPVFKIDSQFWNVQ